MKNKMKNIIILSSILALTIISVSIYLFIIKDRTSSGNNIKNEDNKEYNYKLEKIINFEDDSITEGTLIKTNDKYVLDAGNIPNYDKHFIVFNESGIDITNEIFPDELPTRIEKMKNSENYLLRYEKYYKIYNQELKEIGNLKDKYFVVDYGKYLIINHNEKYGISNTNGEILVEAKYNNIYPIYEDDGKTINDKYVVAINNGKTGVIDLKDNTVIPFEYDAKTNSNFPNYYNYGYTETINNKIYLVFMKNNKYGILDINNKVILDFNYDNIEYYSDINYFVNKEYNNNNLSILNIINLDGTLKKEIEISSDLKYVSNSSGLSDQENNSTLPKIILSDNDNNMYILDKNLSLNKYESVYNYESKRGISSHPLYAFTSNIYITKENDKYKIYSLSDKKLVFNDEFTYVQIEIDSGTKGNILLCKNANTNCGIIDYKGNVILDFKYENIATELDIYPKLKTETEFIRIENSSITKLNYCNNFLESDDTYVFNNYIIKTEEDSTRTLYNTSCEAVMNDMYNAKEINNKYILVDRRIDNKYTSYLFDLNLNELEVENPDNTKLLYLLNEEDMYILTNKGIYQLVES